MLLFYSILVLAVSPDFGYSIAQEQHEISGPGFKLHSCSSLGGSCIPKDTAKSYKGGTTTRCFGQRECKDGFSCCLESDYIADESISRKKRKRKKRQATNDEPGRAIQCPSSDADPRCGEPDEWNPEGGRCRKKCKDGVLNAEREGPDLSVCPAGNGCKCCFRVKTCRKLKACEKQKGECREQCFEGENTKPKGCRNGCVCCVPKDLDVGLPSCPSKENGGRCTTITSPTCDPLNGEKLADDQYSCKKGKGGFERKCCTREIAAIVNACQGEGGRCTPRTKKGKPLTCNGAIGERDLTATYSCPKAKKGRSKMCCLKDCFHFRSGEQNEKEQVVGQWFIHGEVHLYECMYAICKNGVYTTYGQGRDPTCCLDGEVHEYREQGRVICREHTDMLTNYSMICTNGEWVNQTFVHENCTGEANKETRTLLDSSEEEESHKEEEQNNESEQEEPSRDNTKPTGMKSEGKYGKGVNSGKGEKVKGAKPGKRKFVKKVNTGNEKKVNSVKTGQGKYGNGLNNGKGKMLKGAKPGNMKFVKKVNMGNGKNLNSVKTGKGKNGEGVNNGKGKMVKGAKPENGKFVKKVNNGNGKKVKSVATGKGKNG